MYKPPGCDTTIGIWDYYYSVRVPFLQTTSVDYLRTMGMATTGNKAVDQEVMGQWITTMLPIATMIDYYKDGVQIRICKESDIVKIYDSITRHLEGWRHRLERGINIGEAPIEDLLAMDQFANAVYDHAKYQFTPELLESIMARNLSGVVKITPGTFFKSSVTAALPIASADGILRINPIDDGPPDRDSLAGFLHERISSFKRW